MKTALGGVWFRAARYAAAVALLCGSQISWGEDKAPAAPAAEQAAIEISGQSDEIFEQYVSLSHLGTAWRNLDPVGMTDAALQFAEGEHVLLRSHSSIKASQVFDLAIRVATDKSDKDSLARLAKALERSGDKDRLAQVNLALKTAGTSRAIDPVLNQGSKEALAAIEAMRGEIESALIANSKLQLDGVEKLLADLPINDQQRSALKKIVGEARESVGNDNGLNTTVEELDQLGGVSRPIREIFPPTGNNPTIPDFEAAGLATESQFADAAALTKANGQSLLSINDPLAQLSLPSRAVGFQSSVKWGGLPGSKGLPTIKQYVNQDGNKINWGSNCGQAAIATVIKYHRPTFLGGLPVQQLEYAGFGPDVALGLAGTSPFRLQSIAKNQGFKYAWGSGNAQMEEQIAAKRPVLVMLDIANDKAGDPSTYNRTWGFHWTVIYAYDYDYYYCTNWSNLTGDLKITGRVPKYKVNLGWKNVVGDTFGISNKFLLVWP